MSGGARRVSSGVALSSDTSNALSQEFSVDHIYDIRSAVVCLLDAIASMVESQSYVIPESYISLTQQMYCLDEDLFKGIHDRYLWWSSAFLGQKTPGNSPSLNRKLVRTAKPVIQTTSHHDDLQKHKEELMLANRKLDDGRREKSSWIEKIEDLNEKLKTSHQRISELERMADVVTWQKYADEMTNKHILAVDDIRGKHETKIKNIRKSEENLKNKIQKLEAEIGKLKLRNEVPISQSSNFMLEKLDHARQQLYVRDQKIHLLRKEMLTQQQQMAGCMHGLQEDFKSLLDKITHNNPSMEFSPDRDNSQYQAKLRLLHDSCIEGKLRDAVATLPQQYEPSKLQCTLPIKAPRTSSYHTTTTEQPSMQANDPKSRSVSVSPKFYTGPRKRLIPIQPLTPQTYAVSRTTVAAIDSSHFKIPGHLGKSNVPEEKKDEPHPQLVSKVTGRANLMEIMKHFPYLTVEQVTQQWENFRKYDKNNDFSLDLPETPFASLSNFPQRHKVERNLYEVITDVCGLKVTVSEMKEAMAEVDRDRSNNVDFYEFLKIGEMIIKKQGKAALFQSDLMRERGATVSKACIVQ